MHKENTVIHETPLNPYLPFRGVTIFAPIRTQSHPAAREIPNAPQFLRTDRAVCLGQPESRNVMN